MPEPAAAGAPRQTLSTWDGVAFIVGIVIGIGIFKTPSLVASNVGSETAFLGAWLLGGVVMLLGALCYAELGSAHPDAGGEYHYLSRAYGFPVGLLFGWARGTVIQTGAIAAVAFVYGEYAAVLMPLGPYGIAMHAGDGHCRAHRHQHGRHDAKPRAASDADAADDRGADLRDPCRT